jgi:hypothetical protein
MTKKLLILIALISNVSLFSQNKLSLYGGINGGLAMPLGDFGSKSLNSNSAGFANVGYNLAISANLIHNKSGFGAMICFSNQINSTNFKDVSNFLSITKGLNTPISGDYQLTSYLIGPSYNYRISEKFSASSYILAGLVDAKSPEVKYVFTNSSLFVNQNAVKSSQLGFNLGTVLKYRLTKSLYLSGFLNIDYANLGFRNVVTNTNTGDEIGDIEITAITANSGLGIIYFIK